MRIKRFVAHSLKEATGQMKAELGPEAIVISAKITVAARSASWDATHTR
jgi:flagellar biosynthesis GTPase FlhF